MIKELFSYNVLIMIKKKDLQWINNLTKQVLYPFSLVASPIIVYSFSYCLYVKLLYIYITLSNSDRQNSDRIKDNNDKSHNNKFQCTKPSGETISDHTFS